MFSAFPDFIRSAAAFVVVLGVLVFVHELGHYLAARWCGVHVEAFSIGFGRAIARWTDRAGTVWKLGWIPLGGYVKLHGQERPEEVGDDVKALWIPGRTFQDKQVWRRALVIAAGPLANFLLAAVLFAGLYASIGRPIAVPVVGEIVADSAASRAGLRVGDRVTQIDATPIRRFEEIQRVVSTHPGVALAVHIRRADAEEVVTVTPAAQTAAGRTVGILGIRGGATTYEHISPLAAIPAGVAQTWNVGVQTLAGVWEMISGRRGTEDLGGPLRIAQLSGQVAELGIASLISFIGLLSVNLGLINLFPIPVLDGGHLMFYLAEALRGRPLPSRALDYGFRAGFAILAMLFVFATWNDLSHLGIFKWVVRLVG